MSSFRQISFDSQVVQDTLAAVKSLVKEANINFDAILEASMRSIEGRGDVDTSIQEAGINPKILKPFVAFVWDCSRCAPRDGFTALQEFLLKLGFDKKFVDTFIKFFHSNRPRLEVAKRNLSLDVPSFKDLAWRLDVEIGKRSLQASAVPKYQIRLDLAHTNSSLSSLQHSNHSNTTIDNGFVEYAAVNSPQEHTTSLHLQADLANMKNLQNQLQKMLQEVNGVHGQRLTRYIS